ncbi:60S ribosomal protein L29 [Aspergillus fumigatus]
MATQCHPDFTEVADGHFHFNRVQERVPAPPQPEGSPIKKPKTHRYPSLKGVDPKFRRNHRHALHGTMKALKERKEGKREVA